MSVEDDIWNQIVRIKQESELLRKITDSNIFSDPSFSELTKQATSAREYGALGDALTKVSLQTNGR